jgi:uncharacterized protein with ParB-like and HNH nuclease domain
MKAIDRPLTKIINGASQFVIPVFQRDYSWRAETHCAQLWQDVLRAAQAKATHGHFLGSIVYIPTGDSLAGFTRWLVIDGQQRLTTITLLLAALRDHIRETNWTGGEDDPTPKRIDAYFLTNVEEEGNRRQKLVLRRHDQAALKLILDGKPLPQDASERVRENYDYFREQLSTSDPSEVYRGISRLLAEVIINSRHLARSNAAFLCGFPNLNWLDYHSTEMMLAGTTRNSIHVKGEFFSLPRFYCPLTGYYHETARGTFIR